MWQRKRCVPNCHAKLILLHFLPVSAHSPTLNLKTLFSLNMLRKPNELRYGQAEKTPTLPGSQCTCHSGLRPHTQRIRNCSTSSSNCAHRSIAIFQAGKCFNIGRSGFLGEIGHKLDCFYVFTHGKDRTHDVRPPKI